MTPFLPPSDTPTLHKTPLSIILLNDDRAITGLVRRLIEQAGLNQSQTAAQLGVSRQNVGQVMTGKIKTPSLRFILKLIHLCGGRLVVEFPKYDAL